MPEPDEAALEAPAFDHIWTIKVPILALMLCEGILKLPEGCHLLSVSGIPVWVPSDPWLV